MPFYKPHRFRVKTDPLGRTTGYTWCTCGGLSTLTVGEGLKPAFLR